MSDFLSLFQLPGIPHWVLSKLSNFEMLEMGKTPEFEDYERWAKKVDEDFSFGYDVLLGRKKLYGDERDLDDLDFFNEMDDNDLEDW